MTWRTSPPKPAKRRKARASKLDPYKATIDSWLVEDRMRRAKQRHTAARIFDRLVAECGCDGGYTTVQKYVKEKKFQLKSANGQFLKLEWEPGEAQVDFGVCDFRVLRAVHEVHYLVVTFPFSNVSLAQRFWGETSECVCEGLKAVFEFCGGVPLRLVFDNATGVGRRVGDRVSAADTFEGFAAHYGFEFAFCNPVEGMSEESAYELPFPGRGDAGPVHADPDWAHVHHGLVRKEATAILYELGLSMSTAVNAFLRALVREDGMPFEMRVKTPAPDGKTAR